MKIRPLGAELFHADGQTNMKKPTVIFHNFAKAPKDAKFQLVLSSQDNFILHCIYLSKSCDYFDNIRFNIQKFYVLPIPFVSHTHVHLHVALTRTKGRSLSTFQKKKVLLQYIGENSTVRKFHLFFLIFKIQRVWVITFR